MKYSAILFLILCLSCSSDSNQKPITQTEQAAMNEGFVDLPADSLYEKVTASSEQTFDEWEDSLRNALMASKPNENLKSSVLQEVYIRGLANQVKDQFVFELPFDLHGFDCGAPDCYSTDLRFSIPATSPVTFPKTIEVSLFEHGCVEQEHTEEAQFELKENTPNLVNYFSAPLKSNLIIKKSGELYYYPHQQKTSVLAATLDERIENFDFEKEDKIAPYQSTTMTTVEYELFLH